MRTPRERETRRSHVFPTPEKSPAPTTSFGVFVPQVHLTNEEIESWNVTSPGGNVLTAGDILKRTGIKERAVASSNETLLHMGNEAAQVALRGSSPDVVITSNSYPYGNHLSSAIADALGFSPQETLDITAACSGWVLGLTHIKEREHDYEGKHVLLVATEKYSPTLVDLRGPDRHTDPSLSQTLFSDGAAAWQFQYGKGLSVLSYTNHRFPQELTHLIRMPVQEGLIRTPSLLEPVAPSPSGKFEQDGKEVYKEIMRGIPPLIKETVEKAGLTPRDIQAVIPHQGSGHVVEGLSSHMPEYTVIRDYEEGNFSSASVPKAMAKALHEGKIKPGDKVVLAGFGAGLFASIVVVQL